jgi:hypothetical protein
MATPPSNDDFEQALDLTEYIDSFGFYNSDDYGITYTTVDATDDSLDPSCLVGHANSNSSVWFKCKSNLSGVFNITV